MSNQIVSGILILDTAADNIVASTIPVRIRKAKYIGPAAAVGTVTVTDAGGTVAKLQLQTGTSFADETDFSTKALELNGLKVLAITAGSVLYLYTEAF